MNSDIDIQVQDIDHLGLIAGIIDDIGIVELVDQEVTSHRNKCRLLRMRMPKSLENERF